MDATIIILFVLPTICWLGAHLWAFIPPPKEETTKIWKTIYKVLNIVVAANYAYARNSDFGQKLDMAFNDLNQNKQ